MKRKLRYPIRSITEPYGKAGLLVAILALVLATTGAAFAAAGLNSKQKKEVTAIAKKVSKPGPAGPQGPAGPTGPAGAQGKEGAQGKQGDQGPQGNPGTNGANGKSVTLGTATSTPSGECPTVGGTTVEVEGTPASKKHVCNGAQGPEGSPWTAGGTLPTGKTEDGAWATSTGAFNIGYAPASFGIPLSSTPSLAYVNEAGQELAYGGSGFGTPGTPAHCLGSAKEPKAASGFVCFYAEVEATTLGGAANLGKFGATLTFSGEGIAYGSWAVTG